MIYSIIIAGIIIAIMISIFVALVHTDRFVRNYCLSLFQQRQKKFLLKLSNDSRIYDLNSEDKMTEVLQDHLWEKSKELDDNISSHVFNLDNVLDIAYIAWLIYFIHKTNDVSELDKAFKNSKSS